MDTNDLKQLFDSQTVTTNLTPQAVVQYAEGRRRGRQRAVAAVAVVALTVGVGAGAMFLNSLRADDNPAIVTTTEPSPAPSDSEPAEVTPPAYPTEACTVQATDVWGSTLENAPYLDAPLVPVTGRADVHLRLVTPETSDDLGTVQEVYWVPDDGNEVLVSDHAETMDAPRYSDGRFVAYSDSSGQVQVWDSQNPDAVARAYGEEIYAANTENRFVLTDGYLWLLQQDPLEGTETSTRTGTVSVVDLAGDGQVRQVYQGTGIQSIDPAKGKLQIFLGQDVGFVMASPDGGVETEFADALLVADINGVQGYDTGYGQGGPGGILTSAEWPQPYELPGIYSMAGQWVSTDTETFFNYYTGVTVELSSDMPTVDLVGLDDGRGYLQRMVEVDGQRKYQVIDVEDLPQPSC